MFTQPSPGQPWVLRAAQEHWGRQFRKLRAGHDSCFIACIQAGVMAISREDERIEAGPGSVVYLAQEACNRDLTVASEQGVRLLVAVVREPTDAVVESLGRETRIFTPGDCGNIESLFFCIIAAGGRSYPAASDLAALLLIPLLRTIRQEHDLARADEDPGRRIFARCREFILHNYLDIASMADVARQCGTSHARLCRLFKRYEGCAPHRFLLQRKMTHALYDLQQRGRSVADVAYEMGFADPYCFSKAFKRVMGYSPSRAQTGQPAAGQSE